jgi:hypothetical protein
MSVCPVVVPVRVTNERAYTNIVPCSRAPLEIQELDQELLRAFLPLAERIGSDMPESVTLEWLGRGLLDMLNSALPQPVGELGRPPDPRLVAIGHDRDAVEMRWSSPECLLMSAAWRGGRHCRKSHAEASVTALWVP